MRILIFFLVLLCSFYLPNSMARGENMYVIAKSISTERESRRLIRENGWNPVDLRNADFALVVVRSSLRLPLSSYYKSVAELEEDADNQMNISGSNFVIYIFSLDTRLIPQELKRVDYPAQD